LKILDTERLALRPMTESDAAFYLELVNDPAWKRYIGDRGLTTVEQAKESLIKGAIAMQANLGFSLYLAELKDSGTPIGICGLIKRDTLPEIDIGFAFLPAFRGRGYALEAASGVMAYARDKLKLKRLLAIASPDNADSISLLNKIGLKFERKLVLTEGGAETSLFACNL
jgi:RimJ/RimL family protein N-acetyltransferase